MPKIDLNQIVKAYKELEQEAMKDWPAEKKATWLEQRAVTAEQMVSQMELEAQKAEIIKKFPLVEVEDLEDSRTVADAEKLAARIQIKAEKVKAGSSAEIQAKVEEALKGKDEELAHVKKVFGRPVTVPDATTDQSSTQEQEGELGKKLNSGFDMAKYKFKGDALNDAAKSLAEIALGRMS